jgi:CRISPR-associated endoribonuclease Cas6
MGAVYYNNCSIRILVLALGGDFLRIKTTFSCRQLPTSYHMLFVSLLKECMERSDAEYFQKLYYYKGKKSKLSKNFTFSVFLKRFTLQGDEFEVEEVDLFVSSPDSEWMLHFYNGLQQLQSFEYKGYCLEKKRIQLVPPKVVNSQKLLCQTMSPIYLKNKDNKALSPNDPNYKKEFSYIANLILENFRGYGLKKSIDFIPVSMKKIVIKESIADFVKQTQKPYLYLEGYKGIFFLEGDATDLRDLYHLGVGFRRNSGLGMFEVLQS